MSRNEIDARQHRCDQAKLRPANVPNVSPAGAEAQRIVADLCRPIVEPQLKLLSFDEAHKAGQAMFERAHLMAPELRIALARDDCAWADLARAAWEAVWAARR